MVLKISGWLLVNKSECSCREPPLEGSSDREREREIRESAKRGRY